MSSLNQVQLIGNVGKDPEIKVLSNGNKVANFTIATSESWKDKRTGEKHEKTEWHRIVVYGDGLVGIISSYVKKGTKLFVRGKLQTRSWTTVVGEEKYIIEIVLQSFGAELILLGGTGASASEPKTVGEGSLVVPTLITTTAEDLDDDVAF